MRPGAGACSLLAWGAVSRSKSGAIRTSRVLENLGSKSGSLVAECRMFSPACSRFFCAAFIGVLASCSLHPRTSPDIGRAPPLLGFPDTSHGNLHERLTCDPLNGETIEHIVIAYGSGMHGYDSVTVDSGGDIEVILETPARKGRWRTFRAENLSLASFILSSHSLQKCRKLASRYQNDLNDGGQAFLWMKARNRDHEVSCSNVFPPEFSRLWEDIRRQIKETKADYWKESGGHPFAASQSVDRQRATTRTSATSNVSGP